MLVEQRPALGVSRIASVDLELETDRVERGPPALVRLLLVVKLLLLSEGIMRLQLVQQVPSRASCQHRLIYFLGGTRQVECSEHRAYIFFIAYANSHIFAIPGSQRRLRLRQLLLLLLLLLLIEEFKRVLARHRRVSYKQTLRRLSRRERRMSYKSLLRRSTS